MTGKSGFPARSAASRSGSENLITFTDSVAAIGLTLLILPLVDAVGSMVGRRSDLSGALAPHLPEFGAFLLSFAVIFRFWWAHRRQFEHIRRVSTSLVVVSAVWCFGIVFLPVPTVIITRFDPSPSTVALYVGTLVLLSASAFAFAVIAIRRPDLREPDYPMTRSEVLGAGTVLAALVTALVIGSVFARSINFWALLLVPLAYPVETAIRNRWKSGAIADAARE